jgi:acyl-coenzyme A synthetase/AMP-(fatty) acid ligase
MTSLTDPRNGPEQSTALALGVSVIETHSTAEVESALLSHPALAEAAAIGLPHEVKGQSIHTFVLLRAGHTPSPELAEGDISTLEE